MVDEDRERETRFKEQVKRLEEYLRAGGHEIKHRNAMEAVARMHGFKDWHSLIGAEAESEQAAGKHADGKVSKPMELYAVQSVYGRNASVTVAKGRETALMGFIQRARTAIDVLGGEAQVTVIGQDVDGSMPKLALAIDGVVVISLVEPGTLTDTVMQKAPGGGFVEAPATKVELFGILECRSFYAIGVALNEAFATRKRSEEKTRFAASMQSLVAHEAGMDAFEALSDEAQETQEQDRPPALDVDPRALLMSIDKVRVDHMHTAVVSQGRQ